MTDKEVGELWQIHKERGCGENCCQLSLICKLVEERAARLGYHPAMFESTAIPAALKHFGIDPADFT